MLNLYGGQGMGTAGTGVGAGGNISLPQILAMMHGMSGGGAPMASPGAGTPFQPVGASSPMSNYIGAAGMGGGMGGGGAPTAPVGLPQPATIGGAAGASNPMDMMKLLMAMKGGQTGVAPSGTLPAAQDPNASGMGWLMRLFSGTPSQVPGAGGMT